MCQLEKVSISVFEEMSGRLISKLTNKCES